MISAQNSTAGVPKELLEAKKEQLKKEQVCSSMACQHVRAHADMTQASKAAAETRRRQQEKEQSDMIDSFRDAERSEPQRERNGRPERGRGRGFRGDRGGDRGGRGRDGDRFPPRRQSRSPAP